MSAQQKRDIAKQAALVAAYNAGSFSGTSISQFWMDDFESLSADDQAWADAFGEVLGVGPNFYIKADPARKTWLENHYRELATHDTPKGRKAAKVVARMVAYKLAPGGAMKLALHSAVHDEIVFKAAPGRVPASTVNHQLDAYLYLFGGLKK